MVVWQSHEIWKFNANELLDIHIWETLGQVRTNFFAQRILENNSKQSKEIR